MIATHTTAQSFLDTLSETMAAGRARNLNDSWAKPDRGRLSVVKSQCLSTFEYLAERFGTGDVPFLEMDITPYLRRLDRWTRLALEARVNLPDTVNSGVTNVRFAVLNVCGFAPGRTCSTQMPKHDITCIPAAWHPLIAILPKMRARRDLYVLADVARIHGVCSPYDLPDDNATISAWLIEAHVPASRVRSVITTYRSARKAAGDSTLPGLYIVAGKTDRSLKALSDIRELLVTSWVRSKREAMEAETAGQQSRGCVHPNPVVPTPADAPDFDLLIMSQEQIIEIVAPYIYDDLMTAAEHERHKRRDGWFTNRIRAMSRILASAIRLGVDVYPCDIGALFTEGEVEIDVSGSRNGGSRKSLWRSGGRARVKIMRAVLDERGAISYGASYLRVHQENEESTRVPIFTSSVIADMDKAYLTYQSARRGQYTLEGREADWKAVQDAYENCTEYVKSRNTGVITINHIDRTELVKLITLPQALCVGMPYLMRECLEVRAKALQHPTDAAIQQRYEDLNFEYHLFVLELAIGLRSANFAGSLANKHITPRREGATDRIVGFDTHYWGVRDEGRVLLKRNLTGVGKQNERALPMPAALIHPDLATDFWDKHRPRRLVRCGALKDITAYDPAVDHFAVFVSPQSADISLAPHCPVPAGCITGRYSEDKLSERFGWVVYRVVTEALGRKLRAEWGSPEFKSEYRGLFCSHRPVRVLIASWFGAVKNKWALAMLLTNDSLGVLKKHYTAMTTEQMAAEFGAGAGGTDAIRHFESVMDAIYAGKLVDWLSFDPERPERMKIIDAETANLRRSRRRAA